MGYLGPPEARVIIIALSLAVYASFWLGAVYVAYKRQRFISKLIAEDSYRRNPDWGELHIQSHFAQYDSELARFRMRFAVLEPLLWVLLSIIVLVIR